MMWPPTAWPFGAKGCCSHPPNQRVTAAVNGEELAGFACLYLNEDPVWGALLDNLHVTPAMQGAGVGRLLLRECARQITAAGPEQPMYLWVYKQNTPAIQVYTHLGGRLAETVIKPTPDGRTALSHRYVWAHAAVLL